MTLRVIFAGTPEFARIALEHLVAAGFEVVLVLTQPDRPAGRGMKMQASPVKQLALQKGLALAQPRSLRLDGKYPQDAQAAHAAMLEAHADLMVVAAYGLILPQWVLDLPRLGCLNIHASLLPRWRGAAPVHRAVEAGDERTGITIMQMDAGLDTGAMLLSQEVPIAPGDTSGTLHDALAALGGRLIVQALQALERGGLVAKPQPEAGASYARKIDKSEAAIDWSQPASTLLRRIRAFNPAPGAFTTVAGETVKIWAAGPAAVSVPAEVRPGTIVATDAQGLVVATGDGAITITELQRAGARRMKAAEFLRGSPWHAGMAFEHAVH